MCGVAGYIGRRELSQDRLARCMDAMKRRGPDVSRYQAWSTRSGTNVYLVHSRLNIIDANARSNQPLEVKGKWIALNGELYNYREIRRELATEGVGFLTESDTEVLLRAIIQWDWAALNRCEGMWAFAVYDENQEILHLCRDRFGEKPLYLFKHESGLFFGSEVKFIASLLGQRLEINMDQIYRFLAQGYKVLNKRGQTFFRGLSELPPACVLEIDSMGKETQSTYWLPDYAPVDDWSYSEIVAGLRERLIRAVDLRLRADVPAAFCLSGGVDSNALISIAKKVYGYDVHGFTILNSDRRYDERDIVARVVKDLGIRHVGVQATSASFMPRLRDMIRYHDAPVLTITACAHWLLMQSVAEHGYRIAISGVGADEMFTGYYDHHLAYLAEVQGDKSHYLASRYAWETTVLPDVTNPRLRDPELFVRTPSFREHIYNDGMNFEDYFHVPWKEPFTERSYTASLLRNRMLNELFVEIVPVILHEDDLNAMYHSIENRSPYLDRDLFEFCYRIPSHHLVQNGYAKSLLRDAMKDLVPAYILENHRKIGFNLSVHTFLDREDPEFESVLLNDSPIFEYVRRDKIKELMGKSSLPNSESKFLFSFLSSKLFMEEFMN